MIFEQKTKPLSFKSNLDEMSAPGDYCFIRPDNGNLNVGLACPQCGVVFVCHHNIVNEAPLTLSPSVVGPVQGYYEFSDAREQVLGPCKHHFWVKDGVAIDIR